MTMTVATSTPGEQPGSQAIVKQTMEAFRRGLEPVDMTSALKFCESVYNVRICGVTSPEDALIRLMTGRELGLTAMQSLRGVYVIEGKPALDASLMHALCFQAPDCEQFECTEESDTSVTYMVKRKGQKVQKVTWTLEDAKRAGLLDRGGDDAKKKSNNWNKYPRQMMHARCKSEGARRVFSDRLFGLYSVEEMRDGDAILAEGVTVQDAPAVQLPSPAPYEKELATLLEEVAKANTGEAFRAIRDKLQVAKTSASLPPSYLTQALDAYNAASAAFKDALKAKADAAAKVADGAAAPTTAGG